MRINRGTRVNYIGDKYASSNINIYRGFINILKENKIFLIIDRYNDIHSFNG